MRQRQFTPDQAHSSQRGQGEGCLVDFSGVPAEGQRATIRLLPVGDNTSPSEDYDAFVLARSADMVTLVMVTGGLTRGEEVEMYTLYPKLGVGFHPIQSA